MNDEIDRSGHRSATIDPGREGHFDRSRTGKPALSEIGVELSERTDLPVAGYPKLETASCLSPSGCGCSGFGRSRAAARGADSPRNQSQNGAIAASRAAIVKGFVMKPAAWSSATLRGPLSKLEKTNTGMPARAGSAS